MKQEDFTTVLRTVNLVFRSLDPKRDEEIMSLKVKRPSSFSIEFNGRDLIKRVSLPEGSGDRLMIEGFIGELTEIEVIEEILLEIRATQGVLRIELTRDELKKTLKGNKR